MSLLIKNNPNKSASSSSSSSLSLSLTSSSPSPLTLSLSSSPSSIAVTKTTTYNANASIRTRAITSDKYPTIKATTTATTSSLLLSPSVETTQSSVDTVSSSSISAISLLSMTDQQPAERTGVTPASLGSGRKAFRTMPSLKILTYQNIIAFLTVLVCGLVTVNGLKCYMCGQYNEGVGSITPCLNYSEQYAHLYLKECSKKSEKYCVKYVSELSIVRDCATECAEKEIWETQTYCCTEDGCNGSAAIESSAVIVILPLAIYIVNEVIDMVKQQWR